MKFKGMALVVSVALGILAGLGCYTFYYGEGMSYFSSDPKACVNCHIMNEEYEGWRKSSHHAAAVCVDCHMPQTLVAKLITKADNGYRHSKGFTFQDFHEPIQITPRNSEILQANCVRCHAALVQDVNQTATTHESQIRCVQCHSHVGHGVQK